MLGELYNRYARALDETMRSVFHTVQMPAPFETMMMYPMGWQDADGNPYEGIAGKRIRPLLLLSCVEAAGGEWRKGLYAAAAVEILHNFSLVHDDIQDGDETRHNRPTVWTAWGVPMAINAGDALFALSYRAIEKLRDADLPADTILDIFATYNETILELTRGQYLDMSFEVRETVTVDEYVSMVRGKTAALLAGAAKIGALAAGQDIPTADQYAAFGLNMGIAFQIRDDILGIWGETALTGKSTASDIVSRKKSVPILFGLANSERLREIYTQGKLSNDDVAEAVRILESVGAKDYALAEEEAYYDRSTASLYAAAPTAEGQRMLLMLIDALFKRSH